MNDMRKTKKQLIDELQTLRKQIPTQSEQTTKPQETTAQNLLTSINNIGNSILSQTNLDDLLDLLAQEVISASLFRSLTIFLIDKPTNSIVVTHRIHRNSELDKERFQLPLDTGNVVGVVARTNQMQVINGWDTRFSIDAIVAHTASDIKEHEDKISYFIPVSQGKNVIAILATASTRAEKEHMLYRIKTLQPLFDQLAVAIRYAQLYQQANQQANQLKSQLVTQTHTIETQDRFLQAFETIGQAILSSLDIDEILDTICGHIVHMGVFRSLTVALIKEKNIEIVRTIYPDQYGKIVKTYDCLKKSYSIDSNKVFPEVVRTGKLIVIDNGRDKRLDQSIDWEDKIAYFFPVKSNNRVSAVLAVGSTVAEKTQILQKIEAIQPLLGQMAIALQNAQLHQTMSTQIQLQETNLKISNAVQKMTAKEDLHEVLKTILAEIQKQKPDVCALSVHHIIDRDLKTIETFRVSRHGKLPHSPEIYNRSNLIARCQNLETNYLTDTEDWDAEKLEAFKQRMNHLPIRSFIDIPFERGALSVHSEQPNAFAQKDIDIFQAIIHPLSLGIARLEDLAYLHDHNKKQLALLQINRAIQSMLQANDLEHVIQTIFTQLRICQINFSGMSIHRIIDNKTHLFETFRLQPTGTIEKITRKNSGAYQDWKNGKTVYRPNPQDDPQGLPLNYLQYTYKTFNIQVRSMINVPFSQGVLVLRSEKVNAFSQQDIRFIEQISEILSLGIARTQDLQNKEAQFQELENVYRFSPIGLFVIDKELRLLRFNEKLAEINGLTKQDLGKTLDEIVPEQIRQRRQQFEHVFETGEPTTNLKVQGYTPKEPTLLKTWLANYYPLKSPTGQTDRVLGAVVDITQQEEAQEQLLLNEARLKQAMQVANIGIWDWDIATDKTTWWGDMFHIYGITPDAFTGNGTDYLAYTHPDDREIQQKNIQLELELASTKNAETLTSTYSPKEFRIVRPDGTVRTVEGEAIVDTNREGKPIRMLGVLVDITDRKNSEKALQESEQHLRQTLSAVHIGIILANVNSEIIQANEAALDLLGLTKDELLGKTALDPDWNVLDEEDNQVDPHNFPIPLAIRTKTSIKNDYIGVYRPKTKDRIDLMVNADVLKDAEDNVKTVVCSFMDITKLRQTTKALKQSEDLLSQAQRIAHVGSWTLDMQTHQIHLSEEMRAIYGFDKSETSTTFERIMEIVHPDDHKMITESAQKFVESGITEDNEFRIIRPNGDIATLFGQAQLITDANGKTVGLMGTVQDITERKQIESERERTQRLRALGEMAAGISHNLNNILTGVLGPAQMLQLTDQTPQNKEEIDAILTAGIRARDIVSRINKDWRTDTETLEATPVNNVIQEAVHTARPRWKDAPESRGIRIEIHQHLANVPPINGTPSGLYDIVINLIFNAVDAMPKGGHMALTTIPIQDHVRLLFSDTGTGMSEAVLERIFNPFFTTKGDVGTGLGLSTVYGTINRWGGKIDVTSTLGQGTTFTLDFPIWKGDKTPNISQSTQKPTNKVGHILIVDDEDIVTRVLKRTLFEHHVDVVSSSPKALETFLPNKYDILITDLGLPHLPGDQLASQLRQKDPNLTTILISGWELLPNDPRRAHFDFFIQKPFSDLDQFRILIAKALDHKKPTQTS